MFNLLRYLIFCFNKRSLQIVLNRTIVIQTLKENFTYKKQNKESHNFAQKKEGHNYFPRNLVVVLLF